jgi:hypothetical protein
MLRFLIAALRALLMGVLTGAQRLLTWLGIWLLAAILLFEEWGWEQLATLMAWVGRWPGIRQIERMVRRLPPYGALALFVLPALALLPFKLLALYWLSQGKAALGLGVIIAAKLTGTAILARLFSLTQPTLMRLAWFARLFARWMALKTRVLDHVHRSVAWRQLQALRQLITQAIRSAVQRWRGR